MTSMQIRGFSRLPMTIQENHTRFYININIVLLLFNNEYRYKRRYYEEADKPFTLNSHASIQKYINISCTESSNGNVQGYFRLIQII